MSDISIHAGDQMSEIEKFIADKKYDFDGRGMLVIDADDLLQIIKGKVLVDAVQLEIVINCALSCDGIDSEDNAAILAMANALHPTSSGDKQ